MTTKKISDLTATTTFSGSDLAVIVQSGATKKITAANMITAVSPSAATTSASGIVELATNAEAAAGADTARVVTPDDLRYALANGVAQKVVLASATGASSNGDMNISGSYLINGTALNVVPTATPVALSGTSSTITVDFTTYSAYELIIEGTVLTGNITIEASSNAGVSYATSTYQSLQANNTTLSNVTNIGIGNGTSPWNSKIIITQASTGGAVRANANTTQYTTGGTGYSTWGLANMAVTAAANRIKITVSTNWTGFYTIIPIGKR